MTKSRQCIKFSALTFCTQSVSTLQVLPFSFHILYSLHYCFFLSAKFVLESQAKAYTRIRWAIWAASLGRCSWRAFVSSTRISRPSRSSTSSSCTSRAGACVAFSLYSTRARARISPCGYASFAQVDVFHERGITSSCSAFTFTFTLTFTLMLCSKTRQHQHVLMSIRVSEPDACFCHCRNWSHPVYLRMPHDLRIKSCDNVEFFVYDPDRPTPVIAYMANSQYMYM